MFFFSWTMVMLALNQRLGAIAGLLHCCSVYETNSRMSQAFLCYNKDGDCKDKGLAFPRSTAAVGLRLSPFSCYICSKAPCSRTKGRESPRAFAPCFRFSECLANTSRRGQGFKPILLQTPQLLLKV